MPGEVVFRVPSLAIPDPDAASRAGGAAPLRGGAPVRRAGRRRGAGLRARRRERGRGRPDLSPPRRAPARARACRGPGRRARSGGARRPSRRPVPAPPRREPHGADAPADARGDARLEPRPARRTTRRCSSGDSRSSPAASSWRRPRRCAPATGSSLSRSRTCSPASSTSRSSRTRSADGLRRYRLLETIRSYAATRLDEAGEREPVAVAARCAGSLRLVGARRAARGARPEQGNLRVALETLLEATRRRRFACVRCLALLAPPDRAAEARHWLGESLERAPGPAPERIAALLGMPRSSSASGDAARPAKGRGGTRARARARRSRARMASDATSAPRSRSRVDDGVRPRRYYEPALASRASTGSRPPRRSASTRSAPRPGSPVTSRRRERRLARALRCSAASGLRRVGPGAHQRRRDRPS